MSFINWGEESPKQLENRRRMEEPMMFEQMSYSAAVAAATAGGSFIDKSRNNYVVSDYIDNYFE